MYERTLSMLTCASAPLMAGSAAVLSVWRVWQLAATTIANARGISLFIITESQVSQVLRI